MSTVKCKACSLMYNSDLKTCPSCGRWQAKRPHLIIAGVVGFLILLGIIGSELEKVQQLEAETARRAEFAAKRAEFLKLPPEQQKAIQEAQAESAKMKREHEVQSTQLASAITQCAAALALSLHDPYSAKIDDMSSWPAWRNSDGEIIVQPSGRAKNAFGALVHGRWQCVFKSDGNGIRLTAFDQINR